MFRTLTFISVMSGLAGCTLLPNTVTPDPAAAEQMAESEIIQEEAKTLNRMVAILSDANTLYAEAANMSNDPAVTTKLSGLAQERRQFGHKLQARVAELGAMPVERGEALGAAHRAWTQGRTLLENDTQLAAEEVLRGENYLVDEIEAMLDGQLSEPSREMMSRELAIIKSDRDQLADVCQTLAQR